MMAIHAGTKQMQLTPRATIKAPEVTVGVDLAYLCDHCGNVIYVTFWSDRELDPLHYETIRCVNGAGTKIATRPSALSADNTSDYETKTLMKGPKSLYEWRLKEHLQGYASMGYYSNWGGYMSHGRIYCCPYLCMKSEREDLLLKDLSYVSSRSDLAPNNFRGRVDLSRIVTINPISTTDDSGNVMVATKMFHPIIGRSAPMLGISRYTNLSILVSGLTERIKAHQNA